MTVKKLLKYEALALLIGIPICILSYQWFLHTIELSWLRILYYFSVCWVVGWVVRTKGETK